MCASNGYNTTGSHAHRGPATLVSSHRHLLSTPNSIHFTPILYHKFYLKTTVPKTWVTGH